MQIKFRKRYEQTVVANPVPKNMVYIAPRFRRATNNIFAKIVCWSSSDIIKIDKKNGKRLVFASYVNPLVESFLRSADFTILDLAERRQANPELGYSIKERERKWASKVNLLVADNTATLDDYRDDRQRSGMPSGYFIPQGYKMPDLSPKSKSNQKIAVYLGNLHSAIDYKYFEDLINLNQDWTFKVCGNILSSEAQILLNLKNVKYYGIVPTRLISEYLSDAVIGLIPYKRNEWTTGIFPTKLFEYLGHNLQVVSTDLPEIRRYVNNAFVKIDQRPEKLMPSKIDSDTIQNFVKNQTWNCRLADYASAIREARL